jgi:hypothetical protein
VDPGLIMTAVVVQLGRRLGPGVRRGVGDVGLGPG